MFSEPDLPHHAELALPPFRAMAPMAMTSGLRLSDLARRNWSLVFACVLMAILASVTLAAIVFVLAPLPRERGRHDYAIESVGGELEIDVMLGINRATFSGQQFGDAQLLRVTPHLNGLGIDDVTLSDTQVTPAGIERLRRDLRRCQSITVQNATTPAELPSA